MHARHTLRPIATALAFAGAAALAVPAAAQTYYYTGTQYAGGHAPAVDEVLVEGDYGPDGPRTLSRAVSYRDLDLATHAGQQVLKQRVRATARDLCRALGEGPHNGGPLLGRSCEQDAVRSARGQTRVAVARAQARSYYASLDYRR